LPKNKKKHPDFKEIISNLKKPRTDTSISPESSYPKKPSWKLAKMDFQGNWGFNNINSASELKNLHSKLKNFEGMTWAQIESKKGKRGSRLNHSVRIDKLKMEVQDRLKHIRIFEEYDYLYSLHFNGKGRLWGIKDNEIFYILWWDKDHTVYHTSKRHT